jgi:hypothetical protein
MKKYLEKLVELEVLTIIESTDKEIRYNVESDYYMITDADYMYIGKSCIVDYFVYDIASNNTECYCFDIGKLSDFESISHDLFHVCKILDI